MKIRLLKNWNSLPSGSVLEGIGNGQAKLLIDRGIAEKVDDSPAEPARGKAVKSARNKAIRMEA